MRALPLTAATLERLPACCGECVFWQSLRATTDRRRRERWARECEERFGAWGRVLVDGERFRGMMQYGPSAAFARAQVLPAGPPARDAALVTCVFLADDDAPGACERLMLEALADCKARGFRAVEAFGLRYPDEVALADRFGGHHTLFDRTFLTRLGFAPVRDHAQVSLMRLELGGLVAETGRATRLVARLRPAPDDPLPA
ncbi:MAG: hypothetical protein MUE51_01510 [Thermoleophilia bacterium]|nr:hypothetical protein [Thermoleophilia bacterium]